MNGGDHKNGQPYDQLQIDPKIPCGGRIYDYLLGGNAHFPVDRDAAERSAVRYPGGIDAARASVASNRQFLVRAMHYLAGEAGIRQFLDIGSGIPNADHVHALAQDLAPESRVVYVDNDPVVLAHAHQLLRSTPEGTTAYLYADLREPQAILAEAAKTLDLSVPVAVMLVSILHFIADEDDPYAIVETLLEAMPAGSYLALSHLGEGISPEMADVAVSLRKATGEPWVLRTHGQMERFFTGLEVVEPGVVQIDEWRPDGEIAVPPGGRMPPFYGGIGRNR